MRLDELLDRLFPRGRTVSIDHHVITGSAETDTGTVAVLGTTDAAAISHSIALGLSGFVLDVIEKYPGRPLVFLVDTSGQQLSRSQELLCLNGSLAHLANCIDFARRQNHPSVSIVTANAVSGGFLSLGLMADRAFALSEAQVRVMDLHAMARVTKINYDRLVSLALSSPIFAPGVENYMLMGGIEAIWSEAYCKHLNEALAMAKRTMKKGDQRSQIGKSRGGRQLAAEIESKILLTVC